jgi:2-polyprenyl-6-methoxyphenol hydroxylase-like FAD-dependent oxidoreductase
MPDEVIINGNGIAACCAAVLLSRAGFRIIANPPPRPSAPVLMLSHQTQHLLSDVFQQDNLFAGGIPICHRTVLWGDAQNPVTMPHTGLVMAESVLLDRLWKSVEVHNQTNTTNTWALIAFRSLPPEVSQHEFGSRSASTYKVELAAAATCWVESVSTGWLFLIPSAENHGSLIAVGADLASLLDESRLVKHQIKAICEPTGSFPASPRIATPLGGPAWIACGTSAVAFDPIAGEGAGNALREGILAAAVISASRTNPAIDLLNHYSNRILSGFLRHLRDCCRFYDSCPGPWWQQELQSLKQGVQWAQDELNASPPPLFRLTGFELQKIA